MTLGYTTRRKLILLALSLIVTFVVFRHLYQSVSLNQLTTTLSSLSINGLCCFVILSLTGSFLRAWRYQLVLQWSGERISSIPLFFITLIRNLFADLLPARIGTLIYIYLVHTRIGVTLSSASTSFAFAFLFDMMSLPLVVFLLFLLSGANIFSFFSIALFCGLFFVTCIFATQLPTLISVFQSIVKQITIIPEQLRKKLDQFLTSLSQDMKTIQKPSHFLQLLIYSILIRISKYGSLILFLYALLLPLGYSLGDISPIEAFVGIMSSEAAASLPISGIAGFGAYEGTWAIVFRAIGLPGSIADLTALTHHLFTQLYGYSLGLLGVFGLLLLPSKKEKLMKEQNLLSFSGKVTFALFWIITALFLATAQYPSDTQAETSNHIRTKPILLSHEFPKEGEVIFDSNRNGTFGIFLLSKDSPGGVTLFDDQKTHEMYPHVSPISGDIVFARSKTTKRLEPGTIWILRNGASNPQQLIENGTFPSFTSTGDEIIFERARKAVFRYSFKNKKAIRLFPPNNSPFQKYQIVKPRISSDKRFLTFTSDKPSPWHVWVIDLDNNNPKLISHGCESAFHPTQFSGIFIQQKNVMGGSAISRFRISPLSTSVMIDSQGQHSHEYFPSFSSNGNFLLYAATKNDLHSHLTAPYSLYLYRNDQSQKRIRLTNDGATNRWPQWRDSRDTPLTTSND